MCIITKIKNIQKILYRLEKVFLENNGITLNEAIIIYSLPEKRGSCAGYLSGQLGVSNSRTSKILSRLEQQEYIIRTMGQADKRQMLFSLTEKGLEKKKEIQRSEGEYRELIKSLAKFMD